MKPIVRHQIAVLGLLAVVLMSNCAMGGVVYGFIGPDQGGIEFLPENLNEEQRPQFDSEDMHDAMASTCCVSTIHDSPVANSLHVVFDAESSFPLVDGFVLESLSSLAMELLKIPILAVLSV